eukprot:2841282-Rhodomonas_salina.2
MPGTDVLYGIRIHYAMSSTSVAYGRHIYYAMSGTDASCGSTRLGRTAPTCSRCSAKPSEKSRPTTGTEVSLAPYPQTVLDSTDLIAHSPSLVLVVVPSPAGTNKGRWCSRFLVTHMPEFDYWVAPAHRPQLSLCGVRYG